MEKLAYIISITLVIILSVASIAGSANYTIIKITNNPNGPDIYPQINSKGHIVWEGQVWDGQYVGDSEIFLYNGTTTAQLTNNDLADYNPQINDNNHVVWSGYGPLKSNGTEIFLYNGTTTTQLTNDRYDDFYPQINDNNHVVWSGYGPSGGGSSEIFLYNGTTTTQLTSDSYEDYRPQINDNGNIVWLKDIGGPEVFIYQVNQKWEELGHKVKLLVYKPSTG